MAESRAAAASRANIGSDEDMAARPESLRISRRDNMRWILYRRLRWYAVLSMLLTITIGIRHRCRLSHGYCDGALRVASRSPGRAREFMLQSNQWVYLRVLLLCAPVVCAAASAAQPPNWTRSFLARVEALALLQSLNAD